jgi:CheY-like chemotaxis protein
LQLKILAVDDDSFILELIPMILAQVGAHEVALARSGEDALRALESALSPFDCFLIDIQMPEMDGIELCKHIRNLPVYRQVPIIMLTAMTEKSFIDRAFAAGATDYATKPFDVIELKARLGMADRLIEAKRMAANLQASEKDAAPLDTNLQMVGEDELWINGIETITSLVALGNYLEALSPSGRHSMQVFAIEAFGFASIKVRASSAEHALLLAEIVGAIHVTLQPYGYLMAQAGPGLFVCVTSNPTTLDPEYTESEIQSVLDDKDCVFDHGEPMDVVIAVGNPIKPGLIKKIDVNALFNRVVARAKARAVANTAASRGPNIRPTPNSR